MSRHAAGEGTVYRRRDGRWAGAAYVTTTAGTRKRIQVYGKTRSATHEALGERIRRERRGIRTPDRMWTLGAYLEYYMTSIASAKNRPSTKATYRGIIRNHLSGPICTARLSALTVQQVQALLNQKLEDGASTRTVEVTRSLLRAVLSQAQREELVDRNVAKLVQIPTWHRKQITPWTPDDVTKFLTAARTHRWYGAFAMLLLYGMRRGEVLGLTWDRIDFDANTIRVDQQLQRIDGRLQLSPVKTESGNRLLPLLGHLREVVSGIERADPDTSLGLVFVSSTGTPIDPKNFVRAFQQIREAAGLRRITVHHTRHTAATILKDLGVPARDAQLILGHSHVTTTQQLYQHGDIGAQRDALHRLEKQLTDGHVAVKTAVNSELSTGQSIEFDALTSGGTSGVRTHDTLLKSSILGLPTHLAASVAQHMRTRANAHLIGHVAVNYSCQRLVIDELTNELRAADRTTGSIQVELLRVHSFPHNLISRAPLSPLPNDLAA